MLLTGRKLTSHTGHTFCFIVAALECMLGRQSVFAEAAFEESLRLIGVQPFFAHLSYVYFDECTESDLLGADIRMIAHLKFSNGGHAG